jgi:tetratricopeptide (TPR) repeat protein
LSARSLRIPRRLETLGDLTSRLVSVPGWHHYLEGALDKAARDTIEHLKSEPHDGRSWELLGLIYRDAGFTKNAADALERASLAVTIHPLSLLCLSECYGVLGRRTLARQLYLMVADNNPDASGLLPLVASGLDGINESHLAMSVCRRAATVEPSSGQVAYDMCFYAYRSGASVSVVESLAWRAVELEPNCGLFRVGLASLLMRLGDWKKVGWVVRS